MADNKNQNWKIKDKSGNIIGPYSQEAILNLIKRGVLTGDEFIAQVPNGDWYEISKETLFYDLILDVLEGKVAIHKHSASILAIEEQTKTIQRIAINPKISAPEKDAASDKVQEPAKKVAKDNLSEIHTKLKNSGLVSYREIEKKQALDENSGEKKLAIYNESAATDSQKQQKSFLIIPEVKPEKKKFSFNLDITSLKENLINGEDDNQKIKIILILLVVGLIGYFMFFAGGNNFSTEGKIHLLAPTETSDKLAEQDVKVILSTAKKLIEDDNFSGWLEAQNLLVKLAESDSTNTQVREMICFVYKELWPFAVQNEEDVKILNYMTQSTLAINPGNANGKSCQMIQSLLTNKISEAKSQIDFLLQAVPGNAFYAWIKSDILLMDKDYVNAQSFSSSVVNVWPTFLRAQVIYAEALEGAGQIQQAVEVYRNILKMNPNHKVAKLHLGIIEFDAYRKAEDASNFLISALSKTEEKAPNLLEARANRVMAEISLSKNQRGAASSYIEKAYKLNPTDEKIKELFYTLGGNEKVVLSDNKSMELIALGDQYARTGDCFAAQAEYKTAFDLDPKAVISALKAAKCLWKINQSLQAIEYLKKAIQVNPEFFAGYVLLADYYSQRFDFNSANQVITKARALGPNSYEVQKGIAQIEFRKNNFVAAAVLADKATKMYGTDVEAFILLAQAQLAAGKINEAFHAAAKAIELDSSSSDAQIIYGKVLYSYQGFDAAQSYLETLAKQSKYIVEYKIAIADMYKKEEKYNLALEIFQQVTTVDPKNKRGVIGLGECYQGIGQMEKALSSFLLAATLDPTDPEAIFKAGILYYDTGRFGPAIQQFERVLMVNKNYPRANYFIGKAAFAQGDKNKALDAANLEKKLNPGLADSYLLSAEIYSASRKYQMCTSEYQQAIKLQQLGVDVYVKMARCFRLSGSFEIAQSMLDIAAEKESGYPELYKERGALFQSQGDMAAAIKLYDKYLALSPSAPDRAEIEMLMNSIQSKGK